MPPILLFALLWVVGPAQAQERLPRVAVVGVHQERLTPDAQRRAALEIADAVEATRFYEAAILDELDHRVRGREGLILQDAFLGPGRALLDDGKLLYAQAQPEAAVGVLEDAVETLRLAMAAAPSTRDLWEAWVYLGAARLATGEGRTARDAFEAAVAVNPLRSPDPARFPPDLVERFEGVRRERVALSSTLRVTADEDGTLILLNGVERGLVPLTLRDVAPGEVYVHARSPHGFFAYEPVQIPEAGTEELSLRLGEPILGYPAASRVARSRQVTSLYRALGQHLDTDLVLLAGVLNDKVVAQLYSPRTDGFSAPVETLWEGSVPDDVVRTLPELLEGVRQDGTFAPEHRAALAAPLDVGTNAWLARTLVIPARIPEPREAKRGPPKWLTWGAVGLAGAAVIGGATVGVIGATTDPHQGTVIVGPVE